MVKTSNMGEYCLKREFPYEVWEFPFDIGFYEVKSVYEPYVVAYVLITKENLKHSKIYK